MTKKKWKTLRLITTKSAECPKEFRLADRRVYSFLAYRARKKCGASQREISREAVVDPRTARSGDNRNQSGRAAWQTLWESPHSPCH